MRLGSPVFTHVMTVVHPVLISFRETLSSFFYQSFFLARPPTSNRISIDKFLSYLFFTHEFCTSKIIPIQFSGRLSNFYHPHYISIFYIQILYAQNYVT